MNQPLDVDRYLTETAKTAVISAPPVTAPRIDKRAHAAKILADIWPDDGQRYLAHMALAGAMIRGGWTDSECLAFLREVYRSLGPCTSHEMIIRTSRAATKPTGFKAFRGMVKVPELVDTARKLMGLSDEIDLPPGFMDLATGGQGTPSTRRRRTHGHRYVHLPGVTPPRTERVKKPMSDLVRMLIGAEEWIGVWQYDDFAKKLIAVDPPMKLDAETTGLSDTDVTAVGTWFEAAGVTASEVQVKAAIHQAAKLCIFHPVQEYLLGLPRGGGGMLLDTLASRVLGNTSPAANTMLRLFLVSAVRRILAPGTKVDTMLVLYSAKEGRFKSTFVETLFGAEWFRDQMPALNNRDGSHALEGYWGIEIPELDVIMKAETSTTKEFLSRRTDKYRAFGTGGKVEYPRQCVFVGTTNYPDFLESDTGNRRFWPVEIFGMIDLAFVEKHRNAIWAEAVALALDPTVPHWLTERQETDVAEVRKTFDKKDPWWDAIEDYCRGRDEVSTTQIYLEKIAAGDEKALAQVEQKHTQRIGKILRKLQCTSLTRWEKTGNVRVWKVNEPLRSEAPTRNELERRGDLKRLFPN